MSVFPAEALRERPARRASMSAKAFGEIPTAELLSRDSCVTKGKVVGRCDGLKPSVDFATVVGMSTIAVLGTLDTKGEEHSYVAGLIRERGHTPLLIDVGTGGAPTVTPDVSSDEVAKAAGLDLAGLLARKDRGESVAAMTHGAAAILGQLHAAGRIHGVISLGGGGGTAIGTAGMRALPLGFPKVMVSTLASGNVAPYVGVKDIVMFPSIVDVAGLNRLSRVLLARAAGAVCGMVEAKPVLGVDKPLIVASQFGNTTKCIEQARKILEAAGYEVLVFAAVGTGGRTMESLIESGMVSGVLDITTTEWADELVGGVLTAGPTRLEAAARAGVPAVVGPGRIPLAQAMKVCEPLSSSTVSGWPIVNSGASFNGLIVTVTVAVALSKLAGFVPLSRTRNVNVSVPLKLADGV